MQQNEVRSEVNHWYDVDVSGVVADLKSDSVKGISNTEAERRLQEFGPNEVAVSDHMSALKIVAEQFKNILIVILILAVILSLILGHTIEAIAISAILLFAVILGFLQEFRAERAIEALRNWDALA